MKINLNDDSTLPPLEECVVLRVEGGMCFGGRSEVTCEGWFWVRQFYAPDWNDKRQRWELDGDLDEFCETTVLEWWPIPPRSEA